MRGRATRGDLGAGGQRIVGLGDDRQGIGGGEGRDDVTPLPAREVDADPAPAVADRRAGLVALRLDAQERAPALALADGLAEDARDRPAGAGRGGRRGARIAGRTKSSNVTADETGLPGRPNSRTGAPPPGRSAIPKANGLPGWTATRQRSIRPIVSMAVLTTSYGPTETPPDTMSASAPASSAASKAGQDVVEVVGRDAEVDRLAAGRGRRARAGRARWRRGCRPGRGPAPGARTSSPVARTAIRGTAVDDDVGDAGAGDERDGRRGHRRAGPEERRAGLEVAALVAGPSRRPSTGSWTRQAAGTGPVASRPRGPGRPAASSGVVASTGTTASAPAGVARRSRCGRPSRGSTVDVGRGAGSDVADDPSSTGSVSVAPAVSAARIA